MDVEKLTARFASVTTAHLADACVRRGVEVRCAPAGTRPVTTGDRLAGPVLPTRHAGSVDVFLEAFGQARAGSVLVVDDGGRLDQACIGDLVVREAQVTGLAGLVVWGCHRDTVDLVRIGLPVFSLGALPTGPLRVDERSDDALASARVGPWVVTADDLVFADDDGALFVPAERAVEVLDAAEGIRDTELRQAEAIQAGRALRDQLAFAAFLERRSTDPGWTFRDHLRRIGGAIEE
jgi:regulator of RNase E activity RraA